jgi:hypothetical protein
VTGSRGNLAVLDGRPSGDGVVATLRNDSDRTARVRVTIEDLQQPGRVVTEQPVDLPPAQPVELSLRAPIHGARARVSLADPDPGGPRSDDARIVAIRPEQPARVLIVSAPDDRFYIDAALRAGAGPTSVELSSVTVQGAVAALSRRPPPEIVFLVGPRGLDRGGRDALLHYVRAGGRVFIGASDAVNEPGFSLLVEGLAVSAPHGDDPVLTLAAVDARHPLFRRLGSLSEAMGAARFTRAWRVRAQGWEVLARFDDGAPALLERRVGSGRVMFFASDVNRGWNDLPVQSAFVPFVQEVTRYLSPERRRVEYTPGTLPEGVVPALGLVSLASGDQVVVNPDPRESDSARMTAAEFSSAVRHRGGRRLDTGAARRRAESTEQQQSLWRYGLMLMFGTLVIEGLLAGVPRRSVDAGLPRRSVDARLPRRSVDARLPRRSDDAGLPRRSDDAGLPRRSDDAGLPRRSVSEGGRGA